MLAFSFLTGQRNRCFVVFFNLEVPQNWHKSRIFLNGWIFFKFDESFLNLRNRMTCAGLQESEYTIYLGNWLSCHLSPVERKDNAI